MKILDIPKEVYLIAIDYEGLSDKSIQKKVRVELRTRGTSITALKAEDERQMNSGGGFQKTVFEEIPGVGKDDDEKPSIRELLYIQKINTMTDTKLLRENNRLLTKILKKRSSVEEYQNILRGK